MVAAPFGSSQLRAERSPAPGAAGGRISGPPGLGGGAREARGTKGPLTRVYYTAGRGDGTTPTVRAQWTWPRSEAGVRAVIAGARPEVLGAGAGMSSGWRGQG